MRKIYALLLALSVLALNIIGCDDDKPDTAIIHGTITFKNISFWSQSGDVASADSGVVEVVIFPDSVWKAGPNGTFAYGAPENAQNPFILNINSTDSTYEYEIEVKPGTYSALAVGFRTNRAYAADKKTATMGVHWDHADSVSYGFSIPMTPFNYPAPAAIVLNKGDNVQIDFKADYKFVQTWFNQIVPFF